MNYIGSGWQYQVYDVGNNRVLKLQRSWLNQYLRILKKDGTVKGIIPTIRKINTAGLHSISHFKKIQSQIDLDLFGNPEFLTGINYTQEKAIPLHQYFDAHSLPDNKKKIDEYISLLLYFWKHGFGDIVYNFTVNNAVTTHDMVIQIDIGEFKFDKDTVLKSIENKQWLYQNSYTEFPEGELKKYFSDQMDRRMTVSAFHEMWKSV